MKESLLIAVLILSTGQVESEPDQKAQSAAARLKFMKETAAQIEIHVDRNAGTKPELGAQPVLRWDNQRSRVVDAATFVWLADHRPQVIGGMWIKDFHSCSRRENRKG
jgi:hypothetical protein